MKTRYYKDDNMPHLALDIAGKRRKAVLDAIEDCMHSFSTDRPEGERERHNYPPSSKPYKDLMQTINELPDDKTVLDVCGEPLRVLEFCIKQYSVKGGLCAEMRSELEQAEKA